MWVAGEGGNSACPFACRVLRTIGFPSALINAGTSWVIVPEDARTQGEKSRNPKRLMIER